MNETSGTRHRTSLAAPFPTIAEYIAQLPKHFSHNLSHWHSYYADREDTLLPDDRCDPSVDKYYLVYQKQLVLTVYSLSWNVADKWHLEGVYTIGGHRPVALIDQDLRSLKLPDKLVNLIIIERHRQAPTT